MRLRGPRSSRGVHRAGTFQKSQRTHVNIASRLVVMLFKLPFLLGLWERILTHSLQPGIIIFITSARARTCVLVVFVCVKPHSDSLSSSKRWSGTQAPRAAAAAAQLWRLKTFLINKNGRQPTEGTCVYPRSLSIPHRIGCGTDTAWGGGPPCAARRSISC